MTTSISVIIPTHERPETCELAVQSALNQSRAPLEVIVCCDGCDPGAVGSLRKLEGAVRVLDLPKALGYGYGNRNEAMKQAKGDVIAWLADDDLYLPDHLERVGEIHDTGDAEIVQTTACHVRADGFIEAMGDDWHHPFVRHQLLAGERASSTMTAISHRRELAFRVGAWNAEMEAAGDIDLWRRMAEVSRTVTIAAPTVLHLRNTGRHQPADERIAQNRALFARICDPEELPRLRAEMGHAVYRRLADHQQEAHHLGAEVRSLRAQLEAATDEARGLRETLDLTYSGGWWRLRAVLLSLPRASSSLTRRLSRGRE
jgi:glycosyltransferase involved in cell wall biosynthesis